MKWHLVTMATEPTDERRLKKLLLRGYMSRRQKINLYVWSAMGRKQTNTHKKLISFRNLTKSSVLSSKCSRNVFFSDSSNVGFDDTRRVWVSESNDSWISSSAHWSAVGTFRDPAALGAIKMLYTCIRCGQNKSVCPCLEDVASLPPTWYILPHLSFPQAWNRSGRMMGCLGTAEVAWDLFLCR